MVTENPCEEEKDSPDAPVLDLSRASVKKLIKTAKKRGYVTHTELNAVLPTDQVDSEQIEDILSLFSEMGVAVVEGEEIEEEEGAEEEETSKALVEADETEGSLVKTGGREGGERTDDPVRMYLREMGSIELLSREGEIAIAKRIEAGHGAILSGLCESPLTFQAIIIWHEELEEEEALLRDVIDLEASYADMGLREATKDVTVQTSPSPKEEAIEVSSTGRSDLRLTSAKGIASLQEQREQEEEEEESHEDYEVGS